MTVGPDLSPCDIVIFGGTGDLAFRKLLPALFLRMADGQLPSTSRIIAVSRAGLDDAGYRDKVSGALRSHLQDPDPAAEEHFLTRLSHVSLDIDDPEGWSALTRLLEHEPAGVRVFYLAVGPGLFGGICARLDAEGLVTPESRVVLEKPIGHDLASARAINDAVDAVFTESQIFRIDHYLGKESVQNLLVTRFGNAIFEPLWSNRSIDHVQITVAESLGVGDRGGYYDTSGAMRDMVQNHLLQILCLVAMEPPTRVAGEAVRDEKLKVLQALTPIGPDEVASATVFGQYVAGEVAGAEVPGYVEELPTDHSTTETFVALRVEIANWRWAGVPFYLRTGKRLAARSSEVVVEFKPTPHPMFPGGEREAPNRLILRLQPDESVQLELTVKEPGPGGIRTRPVSLGLNLATPDVPTPDAYERLLMDVVRGTPTLFMRRDEVEAAWTWVEPIMTAYAATGAAPQAYAAGSSGPQAAADLIGRDGRSWYEDVTR